MWRLDQPMFFKLGNSVAHLIQNEKSVRLKHFLLLVEYLDWLTQLRLII